MLVRTVTGADCEMIIGTTHCKKHCLSRRSSLHFSLNQHYINWLHAL